MPALSAPNLKGRKKGLILLVLFCISQQNANAFSIACSLGAECVQSQGTSIPSNTVIEMLEYCRDFTRGGIGRRVLRMSLQEILEQSGGNAVHPIYSAYYAFDQLTDSPLAFRRQSRVEDTSYAEIAQSCARLSYDFEVWAR